MMTNKNTELKDLFSCQFNIIAMKYSAVGSQLIDKMKLT